MNDELRIKKNYLTSNANKFNKTLQDPAKL